MIFFSLVSLLLSQFIFVGTCDLEYLSSDWKKTIQKPTGRFIEEKKAEWNKGNLKGRKDNNFTTCLELNSNVQAFRNNSQSFTMTVDVNEGK